MHKNRTNISSDTTVIFFTIHKLSTTEKTKKWIKSTYTPTYPHYPHKLIGFCVDNNTTNNETINNETNDITNNETNEATNTQTQGNKEDKKGFNVNTIEMIIIGVIILAILVIIINEIIAKKRREAKRKEEKRVKGSRR